MGLAWRILSAVPFIKESVAVVTVFFSPVLGDRVLYVMLADLESLCRLGWSLPGHLSTRASHVLGLEVYLTTPDLLLCLAM